LPFRVVLTELYVIKYVCILNYFIVVYELRILLLFNKHSEIIYIYIYFLWRCSPTLTMASSFLRFLYHTTLRRNPLDE
jgi:hypothetical protein